MACRSGRCAGLRVCVGSEEWQLGSWRERMGLEVKGSSICFWEQEGMIKESWQAMALVPRRLRNAWQWLPITVEAPFLPHAVENTGILLALCEDSSVFVKLRNSFLESPQCYYLFQHTLKQQSETQCTTIPVGLETLVLLNLHWRLWLGSRECWVGLGHVFFVTTALTTVYPLPEKPC